jgi:hypothetical protein
MYFVDHGFQKTAALPVHNYNGDSLQGGQPDVYTHYPAFPDVVLGGWAHLIGTTQPAKLRLLPVLLSLNWFALIFKLYQRMLPDPRGAWLGAVLLVLSNYFLFWADSLHRPMYDELFKFGFVLGLFTYYEDYPRGERPGWLLAVLALLFVLTVNNAYDPALYLAITVAGFAWVYDRHLLTRETLILATAAIAGFFLHLYQVKLYAGSWAGAWEDLSSAFLYRTTGAAGSAEQMHQQQVELQRELSWLDYPRLIWLWLNRIERYLFLPGWAFVPLAVLGLRRIRRERHRIYQLAMVLLIATFAWTFLMAQQTLIHAFNTRHLGLLFGLVVGYGLLEYAPIVSRHWRQRHRPWMAFHVLFIGYMIVMALSQQVYDVFVRYGFGYPFWQ